MILNSRLTGENVWNCTTGSCVGQALSCGPYLYRHSRRNDIIQQGKSNRSAQAADLPSGWTEDVCVLCYRGRCGRSRIRE